MKTKIIGGIAIVAIAALVAINVNVSLNTQSDNVSSLTLAELEALANDVEWNHWTQWFSQGLTKDERELPRPCATQTTNSGSGSVTYGGGSVSGSGSSSTTNPGGRYEIACPYGGENCTPIRC